MRYCIGSGSTDRRNDSAAVISHSLSILAAIGGTARYKLGQRLLSFVVRRGAKLPAEQRFQSGWHFIHRYRWLFRGREVSGNRFGIDWQNYAFMQLMRSVNDRPDRFVPRIRVVNDTALTDLVEKNERVVVVTIHSRVDTVLNRVFEERGIDYSVIAVSTVTQRLSELLGLQGSVDLIPLTENSLLTARKKLSAGRVLCTCADFTARVPSTLYQDNYVAEGLFAFARKCGARLVYAFAKVCEDGTIEISMATPAIDEQRASPHALAVDFVDFIRDRSPDGRDWKIGPWTLRTASPVKQHDNFCIRRPGRKHAHGVS